MWTSRKRFQIFVTGICVAPGLVFAEQAPSLPLGSLVQGIIVSSNADSQHILDTVRSSVRDLEVSVDQKADQMKQAVARQTKTMQDQAAQDAQKIFAQYAQKSAELTKKTDHEVMEIKRQAAQQILSLVSKAEEEALKAKHKAREELLHQKLSLAQLEENTSWKQTLKEGFTSSLSRLKNIIMEGETPEEAKDFMKRFDDQTIWFDKTLASTQTQYDQTYYQLNQKKTAINNIVTAQDQAEAALKERVKNYQQALPDYRILRVHLLYAVNSFMNKKSGDGVAAIAATTLTQDEIGKIVDRVLQEAARPVPGQTVQVVAQAPTPAPVTQPAPAQPVPAQPMLVATAPVSPELSNKLDALQKQVEQSLELSRQMQAALQEGRGLSAHQMQQKIADTEKQVVKECKQYFVPRLEAASKEAMALQTIVMDTAEHLDRAHRDAKHWKAYAHGQKKVCLDAQERAILTDELADRRYDELVSAFDVKKTLLGQRAQGAAAHEREVQAREDWVEQVSGEIIRSEHKDAAQMEQESVAREQLEKELAQRSHRERALLK